MNRTIDKSCCQQHHHLITCTLLANKIADSSLSRNKLEMNWKLLKNRQTALHCGKQNFSLTWKKNFVETIYSEINISIEFTKFFQITSKNIVSVISTHEFYLLRLNFYPILTVSRFTIFWRKLLEMLEIIFSTIK